MQPPMEAAPPSQNGNGQDPFVPDLSEGAEVGVYLALLELIDEGLLIIGDEYIIDANSAACRLLGRSYRQLAGQPLADLFADGQAFLHARDKLLIRGEPRGSLGLVLPDGRVHHFPYIAAPRLRPGIHAIVLGCQRLTPSRTSARDLPLHFQPQVHARSGAIHAGEALLFQLDPCALTAACRAAAAWPRIQGHAPLLSINISAEHFHHHTLPRLIRSALSASRLDPRCLEISIDAALLFLPQNQAENAIASTLQTLANMQLRLALDNFGHDLVPLSQLAHHRFHTLKLDPALASQVGRDDDSSALIEAILRLSAPLGIHVLARGVNSQAQRDFLLALGCELQQGLFFGTAQDPHAFANFLSERLFC